MTTLEFLVVLGAAVFLLSQIFNRVSLRWRAAGSLLAVAMSAAVIAIAPETWEAAIFGWFLSVALLIGKWGREVAFDVDARENKGKRPLARDFLGVNVALNPVFIVLYRHRIFRDQWSYRRVMRDSFYVPKVFL